MRDASTVILTLAICALFVGFAYADQAEEAKALVDKAVTMAEKEGLEKTIKEVGKRKGPFVKGALYVWAGNYEKTTILAHPFVPGLVRAPDLKTFKDKKGNHVFVISHIPRGIVVE